MFPRVTLLYRALAVCLLVSIVMILIQSAGEHIHHKRLPFFQDYFNDVIRELESVEPSLSLSALPDSLSVELSPRGLCFCLVERAPMSATVLRFPVMKSCLEN